MALSVMVYNLTRAMNIVGIKPLIAAIAACDRTGPGFSPTSLGRVFLHGQDPTQTSAVFERHVRCERTAPSQFGVGSTWAG